MVAVPEIVEPVHLRVWFTMRVDRVAKLDDAIGWGEVVLFTPSNCIDWYEVVPFTPGYWYVFLGDGLEAVPAVIVG